MVERAGLVETKAHFKDELFATAAQNVAVRIAHMPHYAAVLSFKQPSSDVSRRGDGACVYVETTWARRGLASCS